MSYQVLARKWRPKKFHELMGQEHVVNVLVNALTQQRLHHAYLFTGTRGVGKTTIARIFAKSLNCLQGISAEPCGVCDACTDIDQGRFVDLLEIDAASRTKVDDTREILDNVQYAPSRGRYKVYLIDEVHMLSRSSFNALLKTLEEPPEHVKFILATTDPQKLPITVLSRCLQFHLKALTTAQIKQQLQAILQAENIVCDDDALSLLAKAARGSMRDGLSITDQAIAQGQGNIALAGVQQMLGGIDQHWPYKLLIALIKNDQQGLMKLSLEIASYAPNYGRLLAELIQLLHQIAITQVVGEHFDLSPEHQKLIAKFCLAMSPEDVQLYYQIALNGRKDLPYALDEQAAFDMTLLRLAAFKPSAKQPTDAFIHSKETLHTEPDDTHGPAIDFDDVELAATTITQTPISEPVLQPPFVNAEHSKADNNVIEHHHAVEQKPANEAVVGDDPLSTSLFPESNDDVETALNAELWQIEQDAKQQGFDVEVTAVDVNDEITAPRHQQGLQPNTQMDEVKPSSIAEPQLNQEQATLSSPVAAVLASRNMLRSKKKQLESSEKKFDDAVKRLEPEVVNTETQPSIELPEISALADDNYSPEVIDPATIKSANQIDKWANMIDHMALNGRLRQLAIHATISQQSNDNHLILELDQKTKHLRSDAAHQQLEQAISALLKRQISVEIQVVEQTIADPYQIQSDIDEKRYQYAKQVLENDPVVKHLQTHFQAQLDENSIIAK